MLVAENGVLRAEVSLGRAKVEAMAEECHVMKRKLLEETKRRQVGAISLMLLNYFEPKCKLLLSVVMHSALNFVFRGFRKRSGPRRRWNTRQLLRQVVRLIMAVGWFGAASSRWR